MANLRIVILFSLLCASISQASDKKDERQPSQLRQRHSTTTASQADNSVDAPSPRGQRPSNLRTFPIPSSSGAPIFITCTQTQLESLQSRLRTAVPSAPQENPACCPECGRNQAQVHALYDERYKKCCAACKKYCPACFLGCFALLFFNRHS